MIVDNNRDVRLDDDSGSLSSPFNLAFFYGASPRSSEGSCSPTLSAPGSPSSDSESSANGATGSNCLRKRRYSRNTARPTGEAEQHMGGGKQQRGPFQGVRVKNSVKELLLHLRNSKQMSTDHGTEELKAQGTLMKHDPYTELKNILTYNRKRKAPDCLSDGVYYKRTATLQPHLLTPPQTPTSMDNNMEDPHNNEPKQDSSCDMLQNIINIKNESSPVSLHTVQGSTGSTTQLGKSFFQWQVEQEEKKMANISQDQILAKDSDGDTFLHIAVAQGRRAVSYVLARKMTALQMLDIKEHNGQSALQVAVAANQHLIVQDLVSLGAQVNTTDCWGRTPLHVCAEKGHAQVLQAIQKGAIVSNQYVDLEGTNYEGLTALHCAVVVHNAVVHELQGQQSPHTPEVQELRLKSKKLADTIKYLIQMGASVEARDRKSGRSALHLAAEEANVELLRLFLELPNYLSFINAKAYNGNTALHVAASLQHRMTQLDAVRLLMRKGADPSARNLENEQPVHLVPDSPVGVEIRRILKGKTSQQRSSVY
ncbi:ANK domain-containing protein [Crotalus adamanteus]|uniref:ANK domain-containing protein n=1 Tax=Crotalus adamanteus TaxID=8729 RepID=A0AAW1BJE2_CROAD